MVSLYLSIAATKGSVTLPNHSLSNNLAAVCKREVVGHGILGFVILAVTLARNFLLSIHIHLDNV